MNLESKSIAFDVGNVLATFDMGGFVERLHASQLFESRERCMSFLEKFQHHNDLGISNISKELSMLTHDKDLVKSLVSDWNDSLEFHPKMIQLVMELKNDGAPIIFVSNMGEEHYHKLQRAAPDLFKGKVLEHFSCQVGARKPQKLFYQSLLMSMDSRMNFPKFGLYFIDDLQGNLDGMVNCAYSFPYLFNLNQCLQQGEGYLDREIDKLYAFLTKK